MSDTPSGSGPTQSETLQLNFETKGDEATLKAMDKIGTATIRQVTNLNDLNKAVETNAEFIRQANAQFENKIQILQREWEAEQKAIKSAKEMEAVNAAAIEQGTAYIAKLNEMNVTFGMTTAELQRYRAEQLAVAADAAPLIASMEAMTAATKMYGVQITELAGINKAHDEWEAANRTALNAQRIRSIDENVAAEKAAQEKMMTDAVVFQAFKTRTLNENAAAEEAAMVSLNAQRVRSLEEQAALEESARTALNAQRIRSIRENQLAEIAALKQTAEERLAILQNEAAAETALNAQRIRAIAENAAAEEAARISLSAQRIREQTAQAEAEEASRIALNAQRIRAIAENEKEAEALAEKQAIEEIKWNAMSVKARIAELERLKAYQASNISEGTIKNTFSQAAINDLPKLQQLIEEYNATLGRHGRQLGEAANAARGWGAALDNNRVRTEGIVIAHEALQGRFTRIPGSMMVMAEYLNSASISMTGLTATTVTAGLAVAALMYEMYRGQAQQKAFTDAIARTNDYAGETRGSLEALATSVGKLHGNYKEAYEAAAELTRTGRFTKDQVSEITSAVVELEHAFGTKLNVSIKEFESLTVKGTASAYGGSLQVSKALEVLDEKYHFVNASLMEEIINLEQEGKAREASAKAIDAYAKEAERASKESVENIGWIETAWNGVTWAIKGTIQALADVGKRTSAEGKRAAAFNMVKKDKEGGVDQDTAHMSKTDLLNLQRYNDAVRELDDINRKADERAKKARTQSAADHALMTRAIEDKRLMKKGTTELYDAVARFHEENAILEKANPGYIDSHMDYLIEREDAIFKTHEQAAKKEAKLKDDGRKSAREDEIAAAQSHYKIAKEAAEQDIRMAKEQADEKKISRDQEYNRITSDYNRELAALDELKKKEEAVYARYANRTDAEAVATKKALNDKIRSYTEAYQKIEGLREKAQEDVTKKAVKEGTTDETKELKELEDKIAKQKEYNALIGKTAEQKELAKKQLDEEKGLQDQLNLSKWEGVLAEGNLDKLETEVVQAKIAKLQALIKERKEYNDLLTTGAKLEGDAAAQKAIDKQYEQFTKKLEDDLASAIVDGGGRGVKKLIRDMEMSFAKAILRPILQPITDGIAAMFYPGATQAGGVAGAAGAGGVGGAIGTANMLAQGYKALSGGFAGLSGNVAVATTNGLDAIGAGNFMNTSAVGSYTGVAAGYGAGIFAGHAVGNMISGQYGSEGHGQAIVNTASIVGAAIAGPIGAAVGGALGGLWNRAFGMGSTEVQSQGMRGTLSDSGVSGMNYTNKHQDGGWFRSDKNWTDTTGLSTDVTNTFSGGLMQMKVASNDFAKSVGITSAALDGYSKDFDIRLTSDAAANQKAITDFFTTMGDDMALKLVPNINDFSKSGESASVTLQRLSDNFKATDAVASSLGYTAIQMFKGTGLDTSAARDRIVTASGGSSNAVSQAASYSRNFLSEAERLKPVLSAVNTAMGELGYSGIDTRKKFKSIVDTLVQSGAIFTESGAKEYASLMSLQDAFALTHAAEEDLSKSAQQLADETKSLQGQYDELTMTTAQLRAKERLGIADENKVLFDQVKARGDLANAYKTESSALKQTIADNKAFAETLRAFKDATNLGSLSGFTPVQALLEAKKQYEATLTKARNGDKTAEGNLTNAAQSYLTADQLVKASSAEYMADKNQVLDDISKMADFMSSGATDAELQLAAMDKSVAQLININEGVKSVAQLLTEIAGLPSANKAVDTPLASQSDTVMASPLLEVGNIGSLIKQGMDALSDHVASLRDELAAQNGEAIVANAVVTEQAANVVAESNVQVVKSRNWKIVSEQESYPV